MSPAGDLRAQKEAFVSNLHGTTKQEIWLIISCLPLCIHLGALAQQHVTALASHQGWQHWLLLACFACDFLSVVLPQAAVSMSAIGAAPLLLILLVLVVGASTLSWLRLVHGRTATPAAAAAAAATAHRPEAADHTSQQPRSDLHSQAQSGQAHQHHVGTFSMDGWSRVAADLAEPRQRFITWFRGGCLLYTCIAILAVDFHAFPRRFAKAEGYGTGLMDIGVGATIFAGGLVSKASTTSSKTMAQQLRHAVLSTLPVVALGFGRLVSVKATNYQEHVGEYGVHWNFFLTIAAVNLLTTLVNPGPRVLLPLGAAVLCGYQLLLTAFGWSGWVHSDAREGSWVSLNKEGVSSLWGYWALYLFGGAIGTCLRSRCRQLGHQLQAAVTAGQAPAGGSRQQQQSSPVMLLLWWLVPWVLLDVTLWGLLLLMEARVEPVSRRACNMAYVVWVVAQCSDQLLLCFVGQILLDLLHGGHGPYNHHKQQQQQQKKALQRSPSTETTATSRVCLVEAFNSNLLALFLVANLLTGLVNFLVNTLAVGDALARMLVGMYMLALCSTAAALHQHRVALKLG